MTDTPEGDETLTVYAAQQQAVVDVLEHCSGAPEETIEQVLRRTFEARGITIPPEPWVRAVAGEIAHDRLYVIDAALVPPEHATSSPRRRATERTAAIGGSDEPTDHRRPPRSDTATRKQVTP